MLPNFDLQSKKSSDFTTCLVKSPIIRKLSKYSTLIKDGTLFLKSQRCMEGVIHCEQEVLLLDKSQSWQAVQKNKQAVILFSSSLSHILLTVQVEQVWTWTKHSPEIKVWCLWSKGFYSTQGLGSSGKQENVRQMGCRQEPVLFPHHCLQLYDSNSFVILS